VYKNFLPALLDPVLDDYQRNVPDARDAEVLSLFGQIVAKLGDGMVEHVPRIFESVFQCTLDMISKVTVCVPVCLCVCVCMYVLV
jgi:exportin-1